VDTIARKSYSDHQRTFDAAQVNGLHQYWKSEFVPGLSCGLLDTFRKQAAEVASPMCQLWLAQLGGAVADMGDEATPFGNRDAKYICMVASASPLDAPDGARRRQWARSAWEAIRLYSTGGNYINMQTTDEDDRRLRQAYGTNTARLAHAKALYDPGNLFRVNRNIRPATSPGLRAHRDSRGSAAGKQRADDSPSAR
jgi:FAD/FMN-containing dehydrogenase